MYKKSAKQTILFVLKIRVSVHDFTIEQMCISCSELRFRLMFPVSTECSCFFLCFESILNTHSIHVWYSVFQVKIFVCKIYIPCDSLGFKWHKLLRKEWHYMRYFILSHLMRCQYEINMYTNTYYTIWDAFKVKMEKYILSAYGNYYTWHFMPDITHM